jgi:hypothetical protein
LKNAESIIFFIFFDETLIDHTMKKIIILGLAVAISITACKKKSGEDATPTPTPTPTPTIGAVPSTFTKKVLIEEFTGAWCGYCVDGAYIVETIVAANSGKAIGVSIHQGDGMQISLYNTLDGIFNNTGFPAVRFVLTVVTGHLEQLLNLPRLLIAALL